MANILLEILFLGGITVSLAASAAVIFFMQLFDRIFEEESYRQSFFAFKVFLLAIALHLFYLLSRDFLLNPFLEDVFEFLALIMFLYGVIIITRIVMRTHVSYEAHRQLKGELRTKTEALALYAADLKYSNSLKDLFTDIMSHDLLNPIGIILNYSELMLGNEGEIEKGNVEAIRRNARRAVEMIESAATFSRLQRAGKEGFKPIDLGAVIREETVHMQHHADEKKIGIKHKASGKYPVHAMPFIKEVFSNLISNAIKYSPEGTEISISIGEKDGFWRVEVKDRGEGVDDQYKESIFNRFERREKKGVRGTGLGLAIVKRIVELHNGRVWVEDNPGGGSVFIVEIPRAR